MNFFKLRVLNTFLVLIIGLMIGYIAGGRTNSDRAAARKGAPAASSAAKPEADPVPGPKTGAESDVVTSVWSAKNEDDDDFEFPIKLPGVRLKREPASEGTDTGDIEGAGVMRGVEEDFFGDPARFSGEDIEMNLQLLAAAKMPKGWLLSMASTKSGKSADYVYVEDDSVLGEKPDLKIGHYYTTRFRCGKGDPAAGNILLEIAPTGEKAVWATGISAIE